LAGIRNGIVSNQRQQLVSKSKNGAAVRSLTAFPNHPSQGANVKATRTRALHTGMLCHTADFHHVIQHSGSGWCRQVKAVVGREVRCFSPGVGGHLTYTRLPNHQNFVWTCDRDVINMATKQMIEASARWSAKSKEELQRSEHC
jgi:hypothetical protein